VLRPPDPESLRGELAQVAAIAGNHEIIQECVYGSPGETVKIVSGPLCGSTGVVVALRPKKRTLLLEVSFLGARLEVEIEEHRVRKE
jgi:transcription antitermination factor NusG